MNCLIIEKIREISEKLLVLVFFNKSILKFAEIMARQKILQIIKLLVSLLLIKLKHASLPK